MTIYTNHNGEKKENASDLKEPMVCTEDVPDLEFKKKTIDDEDVLLPQPAAVIIARRRRSRTLVQFCLLLAVVFVLALGVMTGIYLYKHFSREVSEQIFRGRCGVRDDMHTFDFQEQIETDRQRYERIDVPAINDFREATILHDFDKNYTAIIDKISARCYVMPLNYSLVKPPRDFWDLINKIQSGYYLPDEEMVRENYRVLEPEVTNLEPYGFYIWSECRSLDTFKMERIDHKATALVKRNACLSNHYMANFGGGPVEFKVFGC